MKHYHFKFIFLFFGVAVFGLAVFAGALRVFAAPTNQPGIGSGAIGIDANSDVSIGTSTLATGTARFLISPSSTSPYSFKVLETNGTPGFEVDNNGNVTTTNTITAGSVVSALNGTVVANNITSGVFGGSSGNFAFPANLGVGTSTQVGLPQPLSVYGNSYFSGNVGIGTTAPGYLLDVSNGGSFGITNKTAAPGNSQSLPGSLNFSGYGWNTNTGSAAIQGQVLLSGAYSGATGSVEPYLAFSLKGTGGLSGAGASALTEVMRITNSGNVGIRTTTPAVALDVNGYGSFENNQIHNVGAPGSASDAATKSYVDSAFSNAGGVSASSGTANYIPYFTGTNAIGNSVIYQSGSNVGIGTTTPGQLLHIYSSTSEAKIRLQSAYPSDDQTSIEFYDDAGVRTAYFNNRTAHISSDPIFDINTSGGSEGINLTTASGSLRISSGGNVGIGTTTPGYKLTVAGSAEFQNNSYVYVNNLSSDDSAHPLTLSSFNNQNIVLMPNGTGNVGIGTTSPGYKLDVAGSVGNSSYGVTASLSSGRNVTPWDQTFEQNITGWGGVNNTSVTQSSAQAYEGTYSIKIQRNDLTGSGGASYTLGTQLKVGMTYTLSGYYMMVGGSGTAGVMLDSNAANFYTCGTTCTTETLSNASTWKFFSVSMIASAITTGNNYVWIGSGLADTATQIYFDNLVLSEGTLPSLAYGNMKTSINGIGIYVTSGNLDMGTGSIQNVGTPVNPTDAATKSYVDTAVSGGSGPWTVSGSNVYTSNSYNVGIGTSSPYSLLDVHATGSGSNGLTLSEPAASNANAPFVTWKTGDSTNNIFSMRYQGGLGVFSMGTGDQVSGFSSILNITSGGNVGIGTTAPLAALHTSQEILGYSGQVGRLFFENASGTQSNWKISTQDAINGGMEFDYATTTAIGNPTVDTYTTALTILNSGNVGIGTTNPSVPLEVYKNTNNGGIMLMHGNTNGLQLQDLGASGASFVGYNGTSYNPIEFRAQVGYGSQMNLATNGNILFGSPTDNGGGAKVQVTGGLTTTGNVGIGTSAPSSTLTVNGSFATNLQEISTSTTIAATSSIVGVTVITAPITITLPSVSSMAKGSEITVKDEAGDANTYNITVKGSATSQKIDDATTTILTSNYQAIKIYENGSNWYIE